MKIELAHNPFLIETSITVDGKRLREENALSEKLNGRLQMWVDQFFNYIDDHLGAPPEIDLTFQGLETDFDDILLSADIARNKANKKIDLKHIPVKSAEERLTLLKELMESAKSSEMKGLLGDKLAELRHAYEDACNPDFEVNVIATMSSGKSTIINSMLGVDLLPAKNEACTATITRIYDEDGMHSEGNAVFEGESFDGNGNHIEERQQINRDVLARWNEAGNNSDSEAGSPQTAFINIYGDIPAIKQHDYSRLVLVDTPGPNNSQNEEHRKKTYQVINDKQLPMILYVLNATQRETDDESHLLAVVKESMSNAISKQARDRVIFLLNRVDDMDPEKESIVDMIARCKKNIGLENPIVMPVSAIATLWVRKKKRNIALTDKESRYFDAVIETFNEEDFNLLQYMTLSPCVKKQVEKMLSDSEGDQNERASIFSGIPVLECVIDEYLRKYALPNKIYTVHVAIEKIIKDFQISQNPLLEAIRISEEDRERFGQELAEVMDKISSGSSFKKFKDEELNLPIEMPEIYNDLAILEKNGKEEIAKIGNKFSGDKVTRERAEGLLKEADKLYRSMRPRILASLEEKRNEFLHKLNAYLLEEYQKYVSELFPNSDNSSLLGVIEALKKAALNLSASEDLLKRNTRTVSEVVGSYKVSTSVWYNPFTWGDTKIIKEYAEKNYTKIQEVWDVRRTELTKDLGDLKDSIVRDIESQAIALRQQFFDNAERRLEPKLKEMTTAVEELSKKKEGKEEEIRIIQKRLSDIAKFEQKAKQILLF